MSNARATRTRKVWRHYRAIAKIAADLVTYKKEDAASQRVRAANLLSDKAAFGRVTSAVRPMVPSVPHSHCWENRH